jgi:hypothetical protein
MKGCLAITTTTILVHQQILELLDIATVCGHHQLQGFLSLPMAKGKKN